MQEQKLDHIWPAGFVRQPASIFYVAGKPVQNGGMTYVRSARGVADLLGRQIRAGNVTADHRQTQRAALALGADVPQLGQEVHPNCYFPWTENETQGGAHGLLNKILAGYIGGAKVKKIAASVADDVFRVAAGANRIDVSSLAERMSSRVTAQLLKLPDASVTVMQAAVREYENRTGPFDWLKPATPEFKRALEKLFAHHSDQPGFVRDVQHQYAQNRISIEQRNALVWGAYAAAYGTTATAISLLVAHIIGFGLQRQLIENRDSARFKQGLCAESLRMGSPMSAVPLFVVKNTVCDGLRLQVGQIVFAVLSAANFDPTLFANPYTFDPGRSGLDRHMAYGGGMHKCIGLHWANAEISAALDAMIKHGFFLSGYTIEHIERRVNLVDVVTRLTIVRR